MVYPAVLPLTAHGDAWEGKWRGDWRMEWVASTLHTTSEHGVSSITTAVGTRWRMGGEVKGRLANAVGSQYPSHYLGTWCIQHYYRWCAHFGCQQSTELTPPCRFKWTRPFRRKTKSGFCACDITFQTQSNTLPFTAGVNPSVSFIVFIRHATEVFQEAQPWTVRSSLLKEEQFSSNHGTASQ